MASLRNEPQRDGRSEQCTIDDGAEVVGVAGHLDRPPRRQQAGAYALGDVEIQLGFGHAVLGLRPRVEATVSRVEQHVDAPHGRARRAEPPVVRVATWMSAIELTVREPHAAPTDTTPTDTRRPQPLWWVVRRPRITPVSLPWLVSPDVIAQRGELFELLPAHRVERWRRVGRGSTTHFAEHLGLIVEDVRRDYCRMRLPWRTEISQPFGVAHGGALASLIDAVVVPAIGAAYEEPVGFATIDLSVQYLGALRDEDAVAEGWVVQRGSSIAFCEAEVRSATSDRLVAKGILTYKISKPKAPSEVRR